MKIIEIKITVTTDDELPCDVLDDVCEEVSDSSAALVRTLQESYPEVKISLTE